jgi:hypothetical protein
VLDQAEDHRSAGTGEAFDDRAADPAGAAGDKRRFPVSAPIYAGRSRRAAARSGNTLATLAVR